MVALLSRELARLACMAVLACTATLLLTNASSASKIAGTLSFGRLAATCGTDHGDFSVSTDGGYSCAFMEGIISCDAKGNCHTECGKGCSDVAKRRLNGVLRPPASAGTASSAGSGTSTTHRLPVNKVGSVKLTGGSNSTGGANHPVVLQRSAGHSGGSKH